MFVSERRRSPRREGKDASEKTFFFNSNYNSTSILLSKKYANITSKNKITLFCKVILLIFGLLNYLAIYGISAM